MKALKCSKFAEKREETFMRHGLLNGGTFMNGGQKFLHELKAKVISKKSQKGERTEDRTTHRIK